MFDRFSSSYLTLSISLPFRNIFKPKNSLPQFLGKYEVKSLVLHSGTLRMISQDKTWWFSLRSEKPMKVRKYEMLCFFFCKGACPGHVYRSYTWIVSKLEGGQTLPCRSIFAGNRNLVRCWTVAPQAFPKFICPVLAWNNYKNSPKNLLIFLGTCIYIRRQLPEVTTQQTSAEV